MTTPLKLYDDADGWKTVMFLYSSALKEVNTKLEILNDEFQQVHQYNPIEHIKSRIKSAESIVKKLKRYGYETSIQNMVEYVNEERADYVEDGAYWALYVNGEYGQYGADAQPVADGDTYTWTYEKAQ